jgi:hypothetical protein
MRDTDHCGIESDVRAGRNPSEMNPREFIMQVLNLDFLNVNSYF